MNHLFEIYIDRLKPGHDEKITLDTGPKFLNIHDQDLALPEAVHVRGKAFLSEDQLIIQLDISTTAILPCLMCNNPVATPIQVDNFYLVEPLENIKNGVFDYSELLREALLLHAPAYIECHEGLCPQRKYLNKFLKQPEPQTFPFSNLDK